ncbi:hypothetical protein SFRURICE_014355 [Spodoptera frugiperda]|nr:hypothetical protein SFRURICE_014355 [Spodoptera frugiperda]
MVAPRLTSLALLLLLALAAAAPHPRMRRQLIDDDALQPIEDGAGDDQTREKRKLEGVTQAKFGIKNAVLGFVFGKINSLIDAKTRLVDTLDKQNIELNKQYGIEAPQNGLASLSGIVGQVIGPKLQLLGPKIQAVTGLLGGASGGSGGSGGGGLGSIISLVTSLSGSSSGGGAGGTVETIDSSEEDDSLTFIIEYLSGSQSHSITTICCLPLLYNIHQSKTGAAARGGMSEVVGRQRCVLRTQPHRSTDTNTDPHSNKANAHNTYKRRRGEARRGPRDAMLSGPLSQSGSTSRRRELARTPVTPGTAHPSWSRRSLSSRTRRQSDDIPVFDRNKVSLDVPGSLFGPSVSLLIRTTKIIGDVIQVRKAHYPPTPTHRSAVLTACPVTELRGALPDLLKTLPATVPGTLRNQGPRPGYHHHHHYHHQHGGPRARGQRGAAALRAAPQCLPPPTLHYYSQARTPRRSRCSAAPVAPCVAPAGGTFPTTAMFPKIYNIHLIVTS